MSPSIPPSFQSKKFHCPRCGAIAQQTWKPLVAWSTSEGWGAHTDDVEDRGELSPQMNEDGEVRMVGRPWVAAQCGACDDHSLWIDGMLRFPALTDSVEAAVPAPAEDMPANVRSLYLEAAAVYPHSRRASAALCRAALERLAKSLTPSLPAKVKLDGRLAALSIDTDPVITKVLYIIRHVGNNALHSPDDTGESAVIDLGEDPENDITDLFFAAMNELVLEKVTRPRRVDALYAALPEGVLKNIDQRMLAAKTMTGVAEGSELV